MGFKMIKTSNSLTPAVALLCLTFLLTWGSIVSGESMLGVSATVEEVNVKAMSVKVIYVDPNSNKTRHVTAQWDTSTEFIKEGPPPDMKETPAKPEDIKKGAKVYIRVTDKPVKNGKHYLDAVRIKP